MKRIMALSKPSVADVLHTFVDLGIVRTSSVPSPAVETTLRSSAWGKTFRSDGLTLVQPYALVRDIHRIPLALASGITSRLSPSRQKSLLGHVINEFCSRFTPGGKLVYVGDTGKKWTYFDADYLRKLGVIVVKEHRKMPDVVVHFTKKDWLVLVQMATSHGPVNPKRLAELGSLFAGSKVGLVFVTACLNRRDFSNYIGDVAWATHLWIADAPDHMIHFNGDGR